MWLYFIDRCSPVDIKVFPEYTGSPNANVTWSFMGQSSDISHFYITVETEEEEIVFEDRIAKDDRSTTLKKMRPMTTHQVKVIAVYLDGIQKHGCVDFQHEGVCALYWAARCTLINLKAASHLKKNGCQTLVRV